MKINKLAEGWNIVGIGSTEKAIMGLDDSETTAAWEAVGKLLAV